MTRVGELLEILGADKTKVVGAYLETNFRNGDNPYAIVAKLRLMTAKMKGMKEKEVQSTVKEIADLAKKSELSGIQQFATVLIAEGYQQRKDFDKALNLLIDYAAIAAEIGMKGSNKGKVLKANGLSTASWADIDEKWSDAVAQALETGDRALVDAFDAAYIATQERLGKRIGVVEYARILVGIERGEVGRVLASLELALSDLVRIQRVWAKKLAATPALGAEVEKTVDAIRAEPGLS